MSPFAAFCAAPQTVLLGTAGPLWFWLLLAGVAVFIFVTYRRPADFTIVVRQGDVSLSGKLPASKRAAIGEFFRRNLATARRLTVRGTWGTQGKLRVSVSGSASPDQRQQIRNFLLTEL